MVIGSHMHLITIPFTQISNHNTKNGYLDLPEILLCPRGLRKIFLSLSNTVALCCVAAAWFAGLPPPLHRFAPPSKFAARLRWSTPVAGVRRLVGSGRHRPPLPFSLSVSALSLSSLPLGFPGMDDGALAGEKGMVVMKGAGEGGRGGARWGVDVAGQCYFEVCVGLLLTFVF